MEIVSNAELTHNNSTEYYTLVGEQTEKAFKQGYYSGIQLGLLLSLWICVVLIFIRTRKIEKQMSNEEEQPQRQIGFKVYDTATIEINDDEEK